MPKNYTITEAAEKLKITRAAVHLAIQKKKLRAKWALLIDSKDLESLSGRLAPLRGRLQPEAKKKKMGIQEGDIRR